MLAPRRGAIDGMAAGQRIAVTLAQVIDAEGTGVVSKMWT
jgi:hypothetical protein